MEAAEAVESGLERLNEFESKFSEAKILEEIAEERLADAEAIKEMGSCEDCNVIASANFPRIPDKYVIGTPRISEFQSKKPVSARNEDGQIVYVVSHEEIIEMYYPIFLRENPTTIEISQKDLGNVTVSDAAPGSRTTDSKPKGAAREAADESGAQNGVTTTAITAF